MLAALVSSSSSSSSRRSSSSSSSRSSSSSSRSSSRRGRVEATKRGRQRRKRMRWPIPLCTLEVPTWSGKEKHGKTPMRSNEHINIHQRCQPEDASRMASSPGGRSSPQKPVCPSSVSQLQDPGDGRLKRCLSKDVVSTTTCNFG